MNTPSPFVDSYWLSSRLSSPDVCVVDSSWHLPTQNRNAAKEFETVHIPGAVYFDLDLIADTSIDLPHMIAPADKFATMVGDLGIRETNTIIIYDSLGLFAAARVWWNFKIMGAKNCYVLEGGLPQWQKEKLPLAAGRSMQSPRPFSAKFSSNYLISHEQILANMKAPTDKRPMQVVDVRPNMRFAGLEAEPRPGLRSGYMPHSINLPFDDLIKDGVLLPNKELRKRMEAAGIDLERPIATTCGSGVTAPILSLALAKMGINSMYVYDGSWAEWGQDNGLPVLGAEGQSI